MVGEAAGLSSPHTPRRKEAAPHTQGTPPFPQSGENGSDSTAFPGRRAQARSGRGQDPTTLTAPHRDNKARTAKLPTSRGRVGSGRVARKRALTHPLPSYLGTKTRLRALAPARHPPPL